VLQHLGAAAAALAVIALAACDASPPQPETAPPPGPTALPAEVRPPLDPAQLAAAQAIAAAVRDRDAYARARRLAELLPTLGPEGAPGAQQTLQDDTLSLGGTEIELLARFWATHEPEAATRWAVDKSPSGYRLSAILAAFPQWVAADPQAATTAEQAWDRNPTARDALQIGLVRGLYARNPAELEDFIEKVEKGFARQRLLAIYIRLLLQTQGPEATIRWAESTPDADPDYRLDVFRQIAVALPGFDLDAAFRWCEAHCDGPHGGNLASIIALRWAQRGGGAEALTWLASRPPSDERDGGLPGAFEEWLRQAPDQAGAWIAAREAAEDRESWLPLLYPSYALFRLPYSPTEAIEWAERISDEKQRERLLIRIARLWRAVDEPGAEAWLSQSALSEEALAKVRRESGGGQRPKGS
jgi:hypothetical protein